MERENQFVGQSLAFLDAVERTSRAAALQRPVLVIGERGTGKELIAERLHRLSPRWGEPLITMNCAALPETLIEAELFGHEAGAFTGATRSRAGRFEEADKGTLFLDELGTLSMGAQERLLRAVEYGEITRIGSSRPVRVDVRIVAATNEDLPGKAERGEFRADLLDRPVELPDGVRIRGFEPADTDALLALNAASFAAHPEQGAMDAEGFAERCAEPWFDPAGLLIAVDSSSGDDGGTEGAMLGFHWTKVHDRDHGEVYVVGVSPASRGLGLGRLLTLAGLHHLHERGVREVLLYVESDNAPAINIYRDKLGFTHAQSDTHVMYRR